ncbi:hypothetical protein [Dysgonomonas sp. Marseille-P4361]|uniref:hypothetical protein n=1 Tax=Dysgonomonas sp. Marseille-P4361 TaxID=2161820 RepID=UPI001357DB63|nr:hypothetical protein [Dysgonomonas sp. Marseille-P4361]
MKRKTGKTIGVIFAILFSIIALILILVNQYAFGIIILLFGALISVGLIKNKNYTD